MQIETTATETLSTLLEATQTRLSARRRFSRNQFMALLAGLTAASGLAFIALKYAHRKGRRDGRRSAMLSHGHPSALSIASKNYSASQQKLNTVPVPSTSLHHVPSVTALTSSGIAAAAATPNSGSAAVSPTILTVTEDPIGDSVSGSGLLGPGDVSAGTAVTAESDSKTQSSKRVAVDKAFLQRLKALLVILIPSWYSKEVLILVVHTLLLILRTYLSVLNARIDGQLVRHLISANGKHFLKWLGYWFLIALPAVGTNSMIKYLQSALSLCFRNRLTAYLTKLYLKPTTFYRILHWDTRLADNAPDQLVCVDVAKCCDALATLYSNVTKPLLDMILFNYQLSRSIGVVGTSGLFAMFYGTSLILRAMAPPFGKWAAKEAQLEGDYRFAHVRLLTNSEEVAFYGGNVAEKGFLDAAYQKLMRHVNRMLKRRIFYHFLEDFVVKYLWSAFGLVFCAIPVFSLTRTEKGPSNASAAFFAQQFITNKRLMISLADAGGRILYAYKEVAELAGYVARVHLMLDVCVDVQQGKYCRDSLSRDYQLRDLRGVYKQSQDRIRLFRVPVVTPNGEVLLQPMDWSIARGEHLLITGPNGSGKTSLVRILSGLWPLFRGIIECGQEEETVMFLPQRAYLSMGTLRDQIIYPDSFREMKQKNISDSQLLDILTHAHLAYLPAREGGLDAKKDWSNVLSGGEKQRMGMARLFYHAPLFAVLDECTSAVSADVEGRMYAHCKSMGMTLITVSHRPSLLQYHSHLLSLREQGHWTLQRLTADNVSSEISLDEEIQSLQSKLSQVTEMMDRLVQVKKALQLENE